MNWNDCFLDLFDRCVKLYLSGDRDFTHYYTAADDDAALLTEIGYQPREFFDFVEDFCEEAAPSASTALLIAAVRRDYFQVVMHGQLSEKRLTSADLPTFGDELSGISYLPRILAKAEAKLRGELDPDLMFGCGGDRHFLKKNGDLHPADFLRQVWAANGDAAKLVAWMRR
jgi:hypothetical protein